MHIISYLLGRLLYAISVNAGTTFLIFLIFNPTCSLLSKYSTPESRALFTHELGLDRPWYLQYWEVLKSVFTFNFGYSWTTKQDVLKTLQESGLASLTVTLPAFLIGNSLVISVALWMTKYRGTIWDRLLVILCNVMISIPLLVHILIGQLLFACKLKIIPIMGYEKGWLTFFPYTILPTTILVWFYFCYNYRFYRTIMLDELYQGYVCTARAKGLSEQVVLFKHVFKNMMVHIITISVKDLPLWLFGSVVIEIFFGIPGLGTVVINAISNYDFPTIKAVTAIITALSVICNIVGDLLYTLVDPRIKL